MSSSTPWFIGVDPDTKATGIVCLSEFVVPRFRLYQAVVKGAKAMDRLPEMSQHIIEIFRDLYTKDCLRPVIAIESQAIRPGDPRPNDILHLAMVVGVVMAAAYSVWPEAMILTPLPVVWKGSIPKNVHQARILGSVGEELRGFHLTSHQIDALGLALWAKDKLQLLQLTRRTA